MLAPLGIKGSSLTPKSSLATVKVRHKSETSPVYVFKNIRLLYLINNGTVISKKIGMKQ
jgi:hypothetical protein